MVPKAACSLFRTRHHSETDGFFGQAGAAVITWTHTAFTAARYVKLRNLDDRHCAQIEDADRRTTTAAATVTAQTARATSTPCAATSRQVMPASASTALTRCTTGTTGCAGAPTAALTDLNTTKL